MATGSLRAPPASGHPRSEGRLLAAWEARMASQQAAVLSAAFVELRAAAGSDASGARHRVALGALWGKLRALVDSERDLLAREVGELLAAARRETT